MKLSRKLIPAFAMLLVSAIMMTTASYAWFSINRTTNVQGMSVKTITTDNILIVGSALDATDVAEDSTFVNDLNQEISAILTPVSTVNGATFYYTDGKNVDGVGNAKQDVYKQYDPASLDDFRTTYGNAQAFGYVDYIFQIKASNADTEAAKDLKITTLDLKYSGETDGQKAFRVAVFAQKSEDGEAFASSAGTLVTILDPAGATNFTENNAVNSTSTTGAVSNPGAAATIGSVTAGETEYFKVIVRLWLEGEDTTCNNDTFADLVKNDANWALTIVVEIGGANPAVTALGMSTTTP